eukprot:7384463-Prymnesium_polylepis.1
MALPDSFRPLRRLQHTTTANADNSHRRVEPILGQRHAVRLAQLVAQLRHRLQHAAQLAQVGVKVERGPLTAAAGGLGRGALHLAGAAAMLCLRRELRTLCALGEYLGAMRLEGCLLLGRHPLDVPARS